MKKKLRLFTAAILWALLLTCGCNPYADISEYQGAVVITDCDICEDMLLLHKGKLVQRKFPYLIVKAYYPGDTIRLLPPLHRDILFYKPL